MTVEDHTKLIHDTIHNAFQTLYPKANIIVHGAGTEELTVCVQHGTEYMQGFEFEVPSDDDGFFYFKCQTNPEVIVMFAYPEGLEDCE